MRIGVFTVLFQNQPFEAALDKALAVGVSAIEIGTGGYPGSHHCPLDDLLDSRKKRQSYLNAVTYRGLIISALSCQYEPLSPNRELSVESDKLFRKTVHLAEMLEIPVVNVLSSCPAGAPGDSLPNWVTCPWPPHFLKILDYQWNVVAIPYWKEATKFAEDHNVKIGMEMHPGQLVYNVETLLRLRNACGKTLGCNFDPSHLFWNGADPITAIRTLNEAIVHVHGKDVYVDESNVRINGCIDGKAYDQIAERSWTFRTIGYGHDQKAWKDIVSALRMVDYDYVISIEHEDALLSSDEGLSKAVAALREACIFEPTGEMFWL
jgi:sugar phosphate isomerase/epimerase